MTFPTKQKLINWLAENNFSRMENGNYYPTGTYHLGHGEYSQPEFSPRRYKDGWDCHGIYFYYSGTFYAPKDGRVNETFYEV